MFCFIPQPKCLKGLTGTHNSQHASRVLIICSEEDWRGVAHACCTDFYFNVYSQVQASCSCEENAATATPDLSCSYLMRDYTGKGSTDMHQQSSSHGQSHSGCALEWVPTPNEVNTRLEGTCIGSTDASISGGRPWPCHPETAQKLDAQNGVRLEVARHAHQAVIPYRDRVSTTPPRSLPHTVSPALSLKSRSPSCSSILCCLAEACTPPGKSSPGSSRFSSDHSAAPSTHELVYCAFPAEALSPDKSSSPTNQPWEVLATADTLRDDVKSPDVGNGGLMPHSVQHQPAAEDTSPVSCTSIPVGLDAASQVPSLSQADSASKEQTSGLESHRELQEQVTRLLHEKAAAEEEAREMETVCRCPQCAVASGS